MNINVQAADLKRIIKKLSSSNSTTVQIDSDEGNIYVTDSDMGICVNNSIFRNSGKVVVDFNLFKSIVNKLTKEVKITQNGESPLYIQSAKYKSYIPIIKEIKTFPVQSGKSFSISSEKLNSILSFTDIVTDVKNNFDHTGSILIKGDGKNLAAISTDNHRIAFGDYSLSTEVPETIIPSIAVKALKDLTGNIDISETVSAIFFKSSDTLIFARKTNIKFPNVYGVIPKQYILEAKLDFNVLKEAIGRVSPTVDPDTPTPRIQFEFGNTLRMFTGNDLIGKSEDEVDIEYISQPSKFTLTANLKFISDFLNSVSGNGTIKIGGVGKPFMLEAGNKRLLTAGLRV
jgi:DNA polymerase III sliding clamp (beta) subunit (PCNA family)